MIGPTDLLHPSPAPHFKTFQVFLICCLERPIYIYILKFSSYKTNETWLTGYTINITLACVTSQNWKFIFLGCHAMSLGEQFWTFQDTTVLSLQSQSVQNIHSSWTTWCLRKHYNPFKHSNYSPAQFHIPGGLNLQHHHYENLKSQKCHLYMRCEIITVLKIHIVVFGL